MRVLLIQPPVQDFYQTKIRTYPLGLTYIAAVLKKNNFVVEILDAHLAEKKKIIPLPPEFVYIKRFYSADNCSPFRLFGHFYHFGLSFEEIRREIEKAKPNIVGISSMFSAYHNMASMVADIVKQVDKKVVVVMGGAHVTAMPEKVLNEKAVDFILRGECEWSFLELCNLLESKTKDCSRFKKITGIGFKNSKYIYVDKKCAVIQNLDELPYPARKLLDSEIYRIKDRRYAMVLTSRGCLHKCGFCAIPNTECGKFRMRSPKAVIKEARYCYENFKIEHFDFEDDNFISHKKNALEILKGLVKVNNGLKLSAMNGISAVDLDKNLLNQMKKSGFESIDLALVTQNNAQRKLIKRPGNLSGLKNIIHSANKLNFNSRVHIILGLPSEKPEETLKSIVALMRESVVIGPSIFYPVPNSSIFNRYKNSEWLKKIEPIHWRLSLASVEAYPNQREDVITLFYLVRIINFIKSLIGKYGNRDKNYIIEKFINEVFDRYVPLENRLNIDSDEIIRQEKFENDILGILMLKRFLKFGLIEKIHLKKCKGNAVYAFSPEFCNSRIINGFLELAKSNAIKGTFST